jgi:uncharacterized membrane protein
MVTGSPTVRPVVAAGIAVGIGMGGFIDGILLHQIFQLHNMMSAKISTGNLVGAKVNMVWDGAFHLLVWCFTAAGIAMLWSAMKRSGTRLSGRSCFGGMLVGWGLFNVVEGVVDHHILQLHHVYERLGQSIWDWVFLAFGVLLIVGGAALIRGETRTTVVTT